MQTEGFLIEHEGAILDAAEVAIGRTDMPRYRRAGPLEVRRRLRALFDHLLEAVAEQDARPVATYAESVGEERFNSGYDLSDVQRAFNSLEEAIWACAFAELAPAEFADTLRLVSGVLGAGKDALARRYVWLTTRFHAPALDLEAVRAGAAGV